LIADVTWDLADISYDPSSLYEQWLTIPGQLNNLPSWVSNKEYPVNYSVYVPHIYINSSITVPPITLDNGAPASVEGLGLPLQVEVSLSDGSRSMVDVNWTIPSTYDPSLLTEQNFTIYGTFENLPTDLFNSSGYTAKVIVKVGKFLTYNINEIEPRHLYIKLPNGTAKTPEAIGLPSTLRVSLDNGETRNLNVQWGSCIYDGTTGGLGDGSLLYYNPDNRNYQTFKACGKIILPNDVTNRYTQFAIANVEVYAHPSVKNLLEIPIREIPLEEGFQLPTLTEILLDNGDRMNADINWNLDETYSGKESIVGTLTLPSGVGNSKYISLNQKLRFESGVKAGFGNISNDNDDYNWVDQRPAITNLPSIVVSDWSELLTHIVTYYDDYFDGINTLYPIDVNLCWYGGYLKNENTKVGIPCDGLKNKVSNLKNYFVIATREVPVVEDPIEEPVDIPDKVISVQQFNEIMSEYDLPKTVNVQLENGLSPFISVCWHTNWSGLYDDDIAIATGVLCDLPAGMRNPDQLLTYAYVHKSVTDLYFDFDILTDDIYIEEQVKNIRFANNEGIRIHVTSHNREIESASASFNGETIPLRRNPANNFEFIADWFPDKFSRGLEINMPTELADIYFELNGSSVKGSFHSFEVLIYPKNDTAMYINKQVYIPLQDLEYFESQVTNLPLPRILSPANALYNCLGFALDKPTEYLWYWFDSTGPIYPNKDDVIARLDIGGYTQTFDLNEATVLAFGSNGRIFHFAKYDPETGIVTSKDAVEELVEMKGIPQYSGDYGTVQIYFKKNNSF
jgi:hypothetical protein